MKKRLSSFITYPSQRSRRIRTATACSRLRGVYPHILAISSGTVSQRSPLTVKKMTPQKPSFLKCFLIIRQECRVFRPHTTLSHPDSDSEPDLHPDIIDYPPRVAAATRTVGHQFWIFHSLSLSPGHLLYLFQKRLLQFLLGHLPDNLPLLK